MDIEKGKDDYKNVWAIVAYDMDGDEYYNIPHIYCDYISGTDPYEEIRYRDETGMVVPSENVIEIL